jgi:hypothetical protein
MALSTEQVTWYFAHMQMQATSTKLDLVAAHIFLSEDNPSPRFNGTVLTIATIIKFVMASTAEAELAAFYIFARKMVPHRQTLIDMGWLQPRSPQQQ